MAKRTRVSYTLEFKEEAVRLVSRGERAAVVARKSPPLYTKPRQFRGLVCRLEGRLQILPANFNELQRVTKVVGGGRGIRTPDRSLSSYNGLANRRLQPLGHPSVGSVRSFVRGRERTARQRQWFLAVCHRLCQRSLFARLVVTWRRRGLTAGCAGACRWRRRRRWRRQDRLAARRVRRRRSAPRPTA